MRGASKMKSSGKMTIMPKVWVKSHGRNLPSRRRQMPVATPDEATNVDAPKEPNLKVKKGQ